MARSGQSRTRRQRLASIIVVPPQREQPIHFDLPDWAYYVLLGGLGAIAVIAIGGLFLTGWMGVQLRHMRQVEARNVELAEEAAKVDRLERELEQIEDLRLRILELAGVDVRAEIEARSSARIGGLSDDPVELAEQLPDGSESEAGATSVPSGTRGTMPSLWPVEGVISREFRMDREPASVHQGIDIAASHGAPVKASGAGQVVFAGRDSVFGLMVIIDHGRGITSYYGHNSSLEVGRGDRVQRGDVIARIGSTGESSAPHLHFEVRKGGKPINPRSYLID
ncbi:MAG: M23 family metallopeptidase [Candidatus Eiseniibacteriota bacterium]|jgi:murein DD-endopeptidase MepM/ murein hydrolase activator NlpD